MYRYLISPRWLAGHLALLVLLGTFLTLGFWQLDRLGDRRNEIELIESRRRRVPVNLAEQLSMADPAGQQDVRHQAYRRARVRGTFDTEQEVLLEGRSNLGRPGRHVLTPLRTGGDIALLVDRGWVPMTLSEPPVRPASPPSGEVTVSGVLLAPQPRARFGPPDPPPGPVSRLPRVDLDRLSLQLPYRLYPLFLQLEKQEPPNRGPLPQAAPVAKPGEGPHLSYAIQWFSFAGIAAVTYIAFVRRKAAEKLD